MKSVKEMFLSEGLIMSVAAQMLSTLRQFNLKTIRAWKCDFQLLPFTTALFYTTKCSLAVIGMITEIWGKKLTSK